MGPLSMPGTAERRSYERHAVRRTYNEMIDALGLAI